eukprot:UC1_evm6s1666
MAGFSSLVVYGAPRQACLLPMARRVSLSTRTPFPCHPSATSASTRPSPSTPCLSTSFPFFLFHKILPATSIATTTGASTRRTRFASSCCGIPLPDQASTSSSSSSTAPSSSSSSTKHPSPSLQPSPPPRTWLARGSGDTGIRVYNGYSGRKEPLLLQRANTLSWYQCGPTVYADAHLGHACTHVRFDILRRILESHFGIHVVQVLGMTDVDDKIIARSSSGSGSNSRDESGEKEEGTGQDSSTDVVIDSSAVNSTNCTNNNIENDKLEKGVPVARATIAGEEAAPSSEPAWRRHARAYEADFHAEMHSLGVLPPSAIVRVSEHIEEIVSFVRAIQERGHAYTAADGSVYFDTTAFGKYGKLSRPDTAGQRSKSNGDDPKARRGSVGTYGRGDSGGSSAGAGAGDEGCGHGEEQSIATMGGGQKDEEVGGEIAPDAPDAGTDVAPAAGNSTTKRAPQDFALWKAAKPGEPRWDSPWGPGRPGWHIECSAMASAHLGAQMDVHTGGIDLKFPHHENEVAQSESRYGTSDWVNYFWHAGHLWLGTAKMSKSLGNVVRIADFLSQHPARHFRIFCLQSKYRTSLHYTERAVASAAAFDRRCHEFLGAATAYCKRQASIERVRYPGPSSHSLLRAEADCKRAIDQALRNDFDTPAALRALGSLISTTHAAMTNQKRMLTTGGGGDDEAAAAAFALAAASDDGGDGDVNARLGVTGGDILLDHDDVGPTAEAVAAAARRVWSTMAMFGVDLPPPPSSWAQRQAQQAKSSAAHNLVTSSSTSSTSTTAAAASTAAAAAAAETMATATSLGTMCSNVSTSGGDVGHGGVNTTEDSNLDGVMDALLLLREAVRTSAKTTGDAEAARSLFAACDAVRDDLSKLGFSLKDGSGAHGSYWTRSGVPRK